MCRKLGAIHTYALSLVKTTTERGGGHKETTFFSQVFVNQIERQKRKRLFPPQNQIRFLLSLRQHQQVRFNALFNALKLLSSSSSSTRNFSSFVLVFLSVTRSLSCTEKGGRWRLINVDKEAISPDPKSDSIRQKRRQNGGEYTHDCSPEREKQKERMIFLCTIVWFLTTRSRFVSF